MKPSILPTQLITVSDLSESIFNVDTDLVFSATPDEYSETDYKSVKARLTANTPHATQSLYSLTTSNSPTSIKSNLSVYSNSSSLSDFVESSSYSDFSVYPLSSSYSNYAPQSQTALTTSYVVGVSMSYMAQLATTSALSTLTSHSVYCKTCSVTSYCYTASALSGTADFSNYSVSSSHSPTCYTTSLANTTSYSALSVTSSFVNSASYAKNCITARYFLDSRAYAEDSMLVTIPFGSISDGDSQYIIQYILQSGLMQFLKRDILTGEVQQIYQFSSLSDFNGTDTTPGASLSKVRTDSGNNDYIVINGYYVRFLYGIRGSNIGTMTRISNGQSLNPTYLCVRIDDTANETYPTFYDVESYFDGRLPTTDINTLPVTTFSHYLMRNQYNGSTYTYTMLNPGHLNLTNYGYDALCGYSSSRFVNYTSLEPATTVKNYVPQASFSNWLSRVREDSNCTRIIYHWYNGNTNKKRIYMMGAGSGLMHIFNLKAEQITPVDYVSWADDSVSSIYSSSYQSRSLALTYEKSITINGGDGYWANTPSDLNREHYAIDVDLATGEEKYITVVRCGPVDKQGTVSRIKWPAGL